MKILAVGPSWVGDAVMAQSLYRLVANEEDIQLDVLSPEWSLGILSRMNEINNAILSPFKHGEIAIKRRRQLGISLSEKSYDQAIILTNSFKSSLVPYFANIPKRTGWLGEYRYGLLNDIRKFNKKDLKLMIQRFSILGPIKDAIEEENIPRPNLKVDFKNLKQLEEKFEIDSTRPSIGLCPGAEFGPAKRWPVLILGSSKDNSVASEIKNSLPLCSNFFDLTGNTSLVDAIDLLSSCKLVLTNDSGLMHIAAAVRVPLLALYGPSSPEFTPPLSDKAKIICKSKGYSKVRMGDMEGGYHSSLFNLKPSEVLKELELLFKEHS
jgi:heptosyltransferase-2